MKANELRIGNKVKANGRLAGSEVTVDKIGSNGTLIEDDMRVILFKETYVGEFSKHIEGILLTEEWLLKLGWVWNEACDSYEKYGDARMNLSKPNINGYITMFNYVLKAKIADRIFYVHQLQNLFFVLCGEELEIQNI